MLSPKPERRLPWVQRARLTLHSLRLRSGEPFMLPPVLPPGVPLLLDTPDLEPLTLCRLLTHLCRPPHPPTIALVEPADRRALHLLHRCPAIRLLCTERTDPALLRRWLDVLPDLLPGPPCLLDPDLAPPAVALPPLLLPLLPILADADTWEEAAQAMGFSPRHLHRQRCHLADRLDLEQHRLPPRLFGQRVLAALQTAPVAAPLWERAVG